jgi:hypothetical protein
LDVGNYWALARFIFPESLEVTNDETTTEYAWLWPIIVEAARSQPELMAPQIAAVIGDFQGGYTISRQKLAAFFGPWGFEILGVLAGSAQTDPDYMGRARDQARALAAEGSSEQHPA